MAWQRPGYILQTVRSGCQLHLPNRQPSTLSQCLLYPAATKQPQLPKKHRQFSTQPARRNATSSGLVASPAPAAAPIDFSNPNAVPARILPASPAYFSGCPKFTDYYLKLQHLQSKYASLPTVDPSEAPRRAWLKLPHFRVKLCEEVPSAKYKRFVKILQRLSRIHPDLIPKEVEEAMARWRRPGNPYETRPISTDLDELGRSRGVGRRKRSSSIAWLVEGEGEVMINGKSLVSVFPRLHDRESALWPLRCTGRLDKYNVWALTQGGGSTGQAESMTVAVARALMVHEPALKPILRRGMYIPAYQPPPLLLFYLLTIVLQPDVSQPILDRWRGRSQAMSRRGRCPPGSRDEEWYCVFFPHFHSSHCYISPLPFLAL